MAAAALLLCLLSVLLSLSLLSRLWRRGDGRGPRWGALHLLHPQGALHLSRLARRHGPVLRLRAGGRGECGTPEPDPDRTARDPRTRPHPNCPGPPNLTSTQPARDRRTRPQPNLLGPPNPAPAQPPGTPQPPKFPSLLPRDSPNPQPCPSPLPWGPLLKPPKHFLGPNPPMLPPKSHARTPHLVWDLPQFWSTPSPSSSLQRCWCRARWRPSARRWSGTGETGWGAPTVIWVWGQGGPLEGFLWGLGSILCVVKPFRGFEGSHCVVCGGSLWGLGGSLRVWGSYGMASLYGF